MNAKDAAKTQRKAERLTLELENTVEDQTWSEKAIAAHRFVENHEPELRTDRTAVEKEFARLDAIHHGSTADHSVQVKTDDVHEGEALEIAFWIFNAVEMLASAQLARMFWTAPAAVSMPVAGAFSWALSKCLTPTASRMIRHEAERQGPIMKARVHKLLVGLGLPWVISFVGALCMLRSAGTGLGDLLFALFTAVVALLSPCLAAICKAAAPLFLWSRDLARLQRAIRRALVAVNTLRALVEGQFARRQPDLRRIITPEPQGAETAALRRSGKNGFRGRDGAAQLVIAALLLLPAALSTGYGQQQKPEGLGSPVGAGRLEVTAKIDNSSSPDRRRLFSRLDIFLNLLGQDAREIEIELTAFGADGWNERVVAVGQLPALRGGPCSKKPSELERLAKRAQEEHNRFCANETAEKERSVVAARRKELDRLRESVRNLTPEAETECTAVYDSIRMAQYSGNSPAGSNHKVVVIFSDFEETCRKTIPKAPPGPVRNRVFAVPVGPGAPGDRGPAGIGRLRSDSEFFEGVQALLGKTFPDIRVLEPYRLAEVLQ